MANLLLISSSRVHGSGFLEHCREAVAEHFSGVQRLLFIPYALHDHDRYLEIVATALASLPVQVESIHQASDPAAAVARADGLFIGGGNSFRLLRQLYTNCLISEIRSAVIDRGIPYMGSSAGTNMACPTMRTSNDMPIVEPPSLNTLGLVPFQINPHFIDADPGSTHQGETREQRLAEFHEDNATPVVGLREGSWLNVCGNRCLLSGTTGMKLFRRGHSPQEYSAGDISFLMDESCGSG